MRWLFPNPPADSKIADAIAREFNLSPLISQLLFQRNITTSEAAERFLHPRIEHLHPPEKMLGMSQAVTRIELAIATKEKILIYGDYDVDGTIAVLLLKTCIDSLGGVCDFHVPHRILEGYGMKDEVIERAAADGIKLVISVDTGIRAFAAAETAARLSLDLIVTDHHLPETSEEPDAPTIPTALAVLNPNQKDCPYPCKDLCGAGVVFKLCSALLTRAGKERQLPSYLKMVAIATIADSVPLTGENRTIVSLGIAGLRTALKGGIKSLFEIAQLTSPGHKLTSTDIAFRIAPRINAAGRMDVAHDVVDLFLTHDAARQTELARKLDRLNSERQGEEQRVLRALHQRLDEDETLRNAFCIVLDGDEWHRGVIGICASRIVERTGRPTLVFSCDPATSEAHGSGRSIPGFHLLNALESSAVKPLFTRFGGHAAAVGGSLPTSRIADLRAALNDYASTSLTQDDLIPALNIDADIALADITHDLVAHLSQLEPFGMGNRGPIFAARGVTLTQSLRIMKEKHVKLRLTQSQRSGNNNSKPIDALGWGWAERMKTLMPIVGESFNAAFTIEENTNPDFGGLQLILKDLQR